MASQNNENFDSNNLQFTPPSRTVAAKQMGILRQNQQKLNLNPLFNIKPIEIEKDKLSEAVIQFYLQNEIMANQLRSCELELLQAKSRVMKLEATTEGLVSKLEMSTKKKNRRTAEEIDKNFQCPYGECEKCYGSEVSLNLHIKIKHNGGNKTERELLAKEIISARISGKVDPEVHLNLPPGYLDKLSASQ